MENAEGARLRRYDIKMSEEYKNKYLNLLKFRIRNKLLADVDCHLHHIAPKFLNPNKNGLIRLTQKEHCLAHYYLWRGFAKSKNRTRVKYLFNAYKGLSVAFGNDKYKTKRMKQFKKDFEQKILNDKED